MACKYKLACSQLQVALLSSSFGMFQNWHIYLSFSPPFIPTGKVWILFQWSRILWDKWETRFYFNELQPKSEPFFTGTRGPFFINTRPCFIESGWTHWVATISTLNDFLLDFLIKFGWGTQWARAQTCPVFWLLKISCQWYPIRVSW